jgi:hypothetical protein
MNNYIVHENQTLLDVSAHVYGRVDVVVVLALLNNISITAILTAGQIIKLVEAPVNSLVKKSIESRNIIPATAFLQLPTNSNSNDYLLPNLFPILL